MLTRGSEGSIIGTNGLNPASRPQVSEDSLASHTSRAHVLVARAPHVGAPTWLDSWADREVLFDAGKRVHYKVPVVDVADGSGGIAHIGKRQWTCCPPADVLGGAGH